MGEVLSYNWVGASGFEVKIENERFNVITLQAEPFFCLLDFGVLEKGSA